jgi:flagellar biosynthesis protein FlhF
MKIKRYIAVSMRAALAQVRSEQGPDAVILSSRRTEEGIEVIAAVDYDEALFADATRQRMPAAPASASSDDSGTFAVLATANTPVTVVPPPKRSASPQSPPQPQAAVAPRPTPQPKAVAAPKPAPQPKALVKPAVVLPPVASPPPLTQPRPAPPVVPAADSGYLALRRELKELSELMRGELAHKSRNDKRLREPLQARVLDALMAMDIAEDVALGLAKLTPHRTNLNDPSHIPLALLVRHLPVVPQLNTVHGGVIALVGPTGSGKTTTIAKLAARWSMQHGSQDLALVSTDRYRVGAREQLMTYARILGAPVHTAGSGKELAQVLHRLKEKKLVLIDTAGMGPRDSRLSEQLAAVRLGAPRARILLALPAHGEAHALEAAVQSFSILKPAACILTKIDEAASLGAVISTTLRHQLPIAYLCNGQRVPEDLHAAHQRRVWLVRVALKLKRQVPPRAGDAGAARRGGQSPGEVRAHA